MTTNETGNDANQNTTDIMYSNNPNGTSKGTSTPDNVWVFSYEIDNVKVDGSQKEDVTATVSADNDLKEAIDAAITEGAKAYTAADGTVYTKDGDKYYTLPKFAGVGFQLKKGSEVVKLKLNEAGTAYRPATDAEITAASNDEKWEITSLATTGSFNIVGLEEGTYTLTESTVPTGYNKAADITATITVTKTEEDVNKGKVTLTTSSVDNTIINEKGSTLPETGGIGTTIFYVLGSVMALGALVLLVTKRRVNVQ